MVVSPGSVDIASCTKIVGIVRNALNELHYQLSQERKQSLKLSGEDRDYDTPKVAEQIFYLLKQVAVKRVPKPLIPIIYVFTRVDIFRAPYNGAVVWGLRSIFLLHLVYVLKTRQAPFVVAWNEVKIRELFVIFQSSAGFYNKGIPLCVCNGVKP